MRKPTPRHWPLLLGIALRLISTRAALWWYPLPRVLERLSRSSSSRATDLSPEDLHRWIVSIERRIFGAPSCLHSSLVLFWILGVPSSLHVGVRREKDELEAHAWIEVEGASLSTTRLFNYERLLVVHKPAHNP